MNKQEQAMARLEQQGFRFCNWIQDRMGYIPPEEEPHPDALMRKTTKGFLHEYRQIDWNGNVA
jgi:hypothetical protein